MMDKHHAIRIAVSHLKGVDREVEILRLLTNPNLIKEIVSKKLSWRVRRQLKTR